MADLRKEKRRKQTCDRLPQEIKKICVKTKRCKTKQERTAQRCKSKNVNRYKKCKKRQENLANRCIKQKKKDVNEEGGVKRNKELTRKSVPVTRN